MAGSRCSALAAEPHQGLAPWTSLIAEGVFQTLELNKNPQIPKTDPCNFSFPTCLALRPDSALCPQTARTAMQIQGGEIHLVQNRQVKGQSQPFQITPQIFSFEMKMKSQHPSGQPHS